MRFYDFYIYLIIFLKTIFFILSFVEIYYKIKNRQNDSNNNNITNQKTLEYVQYLRSRIEFVVTILMALLLVYIFNPLYPKLNMIDRETKYLFFVFGAILFFTSNWSDFFTLNKNIVLAQEILS